MSKTAYALAMTAPMLGVALIASPAAAHEGGGGQGRGTFGAHLAPVPHDPAADSGSHVRARAELVRQGNRVEVQVKAKGLSPELPHVMHIHGEAQTFAECPGAEAAEGGVDDGLIETVDGLEDYGPIAVSFTTEGGTSADVEDALALDRAPVADEAGRFFYERTIKVPSDIRKNLDDMHIVIHGEDLNDNGKYDEGPITELGAPLEAELPVACGEIHAR